MNSFLLSKSKCLPFVDQECINAHGDASEIKLMKISYSEHVTNQAEKNAFSAF